MFITVWICIVVVYVSIVFGFELGKFVAIDPLAKGYKESLKELEEAKKKIAAKKPMTML